MDGRLLELAQAAKEKAAMGAGEAFATMIEHLAHPWHRARGKVVVRVRHYRIHPRSGGATRYLRGRGFVRGWYCAPPIVYVIEAHQKPSERGGVTQAEVQIDGQTFFAEARCSLKDQYVYQIGRDIAVGRLRKLVEEAGLADRVEWPD